METDRPDHEEWAASEVPEDQRKPEPEPIPVLWFTKGQWALVILGFVLAGLILVLA